MHLTPKWKRRLIRLVNLLIGVGILLAAASLWRWYQDGGGFEVIYGVIVVVLTSLLAVRSRLVPKNSEPETYPAEPSTPTTDEAFISRRRRIATDYTLEELKTLAADMGLDFDSLAGETKEGKIVSLLKICERNGQLNHLDQHIEKERPSASWGKTQKQYLTELRDNLEKEESNNLDNYIPLSASLQKIKLREPNSTEESPYTVLPPEPVPNLDQVSIRQFVLLGEPGGGKSTTLRRRAMQSIAAYEQTKRVPLLLDLSRWPRKELNEQTNQNFESYLQYVWQHDYGFSGEVDRNSVILLLDGLNEMPNEDKRRSERINSLKQFIKKWATTSIVVTCRENEYTSELDLELPRLTLEPLNPQQIEQYLEQKEAYDLWEQIKPETMTSVTSLYELVNNPFLLTLYVATYIDRNARLSVTVAHENLDKTQGQLIEEYVRYLWKREGDQAYRPHYHHVPPLEELQYALGELAFQMIDRGKGTSVDADFARDVIPARFKRKPLHKELLLRLAESALLIEISRDGYSAIRFTHQLFQEYFAALAVQRKNSSDQSFIRKLITSSLFERTAYRSATRDGHVEANKWDKVINMLAGLQKSLDNFVEKVLRFDPFLAVYISQENHTNATTQAYIIEYCLKHLQNALQKNDRSLARIYALVFTKLSADQAVPLLLKFKQNAYDRDDVNLVNRAYETIVNKHGVVTLLNALPTNLPEYPGEKAVWIFIKHENEDFYFDHMYMVMQDFSSGDENVRERLYQDGRLHMMKEAIILDSDVDRAIEILKSPDTSYFYSLLGTLFHRRIVNWTQTLLRHPSGLDVYNLFGSLLRNKNTRSEDIIAIVQNNVLAETALRYFYGNKEIATTFLSNSQLASEVVVAIKKEGWTYKTGSLLKFMPSDISLVALADMIIQADEKEIEEPSSGFLYQVIHEVTQEQSCYIPLSESTLNDLISLAGIDSQPKRRNGLAAIILGRLKQNKAIPVLLEGARLGSHHHIHALGYIGRTNTNQDTEIISTLLNVFKSHINSAAALTLGILKAVEAVPELTKTLRHSIHTGDIYLATNFVQALGNIGISTPETTSILEEIMAYKLADDVDKSDWFKLKKQATIALHQLVDTKSALALSKTLVQLTETKWPSYSEPSKLIDTLLDLIEITNDRTPTTISSCISFLTFLQQLDIPYMQVSRQDLYQKLITLMGRWCIPEMIPVLRSVLYDSRANETLWGLSLEQLGMIGTDEAVEAICTVYGNRKEDYSSPDGVYTFDTHDRLCGVATRIIVQIGKESTFSIFMRTLKQLFLEEKLPNYWLGDVESELKKIDKQEVLQNYFRPWLKMEMTSKLRNIFVRSLNWKKSETYHALDDVMDKSFPGYEFALEIFKKREQERIRTEATALAIDKKRILTLNKCLDSKTDESKKKWFWS